MSLHLARSCGRGMSAIPPLLEGKQTLGELPENDAHYPTETSACRRKALDKIFPYASFIECQALLRTREAAEDGGKVNQEHLVVLASGDRRVLRP